MSTYIRPIRTLDELGRLIHSARYTNEPDFYESINQRMNASPDLRGQMSESYDYADLVSIRETNGKNFALIEEIRERNRAQIIEDNLQLQKGKL